MTSNLLIIARSEFYRTLFNPLVIVVGVILLAITSLSAAGGIGDLKSLSEIWGCDGFIIGFSQIWYNTNFICGIMAAYLGVMSLSGERSRGSLDLLLTKPLYRRDVVLGKFSGICLFMLIFLTVIMIANSLFLLSFFGAPSSVGEFLWRITMYTIILLMDLSLVTGITMFIGIFCKDLLVAVSVVVTYLSYEWFWNQVTAVLSYMLNFPVTPYMLTMKIFGMNTISLFNTNNGFLLWIGDVYPYLFLMGFLVMFVLLLNCLIYARLADA